ncbi:unnamed protein product, partial [Nesidiocoris tenuis]
LGFRGRGKISFNPQEILDQPIRRPGTAPAPQPDPPVLTNGSSAKLIPFDRFFTGDPIDEFELYRTMEQFLLRDSCTLSDMEQMMEYLNQKALQSDRNVPTICKYLYVFSKDPIVGDNVRAAFYSNLENNFMGREKLKLREGPTRYRNFIRWVMAAAHHFRNLLYAPFDDLLFSLLTLADEISNFNDSEDIPLYCILILRFCYYSTLPQSNGTLVSVQLGEQYKSAVNRARDVVRRKLMRGGLSAVQTGWLCLVLEVSWSTKYLED